MIIKKNEFKAFTISSEKYYFLTINLLTSIIVNNIKIDLEIYCFDHIVMEKLDFFIESNGYNQFKTTFFGHDFDDIDDFPIIGTNEFNKIMFLQLKVINKNLMENKYSLYIDGDVVVLKNFKNDLMKKIKNYHVLAQPEINVDNPKRKELGLGFILIKSSFITKLIFNHNFLKRNEFKFHGQALINSKRKWFKYKYLEEELYPGGSFYFRNLENITPNIIHFNYTLGNEKIDTIRKYGYWYLDNDQK